MEDCQLARFVLGGRHFYFRTSWRDVDFEIHITDGRQVWHGHAEEEFIENALKPAEMELDEYMKLTKRALTVQDVTKKHFSYRLSQGQSPSELHLTWRIKLGQDSQIGFSVKGTLPLALVKDGRSIVQQCLDSLIDRQTVLERSNKELRTQNEALFSQRDNALAQLNVLVEEKKAMESDLYNKILNEKKKKIRELKQQGRNGTVNLSDEEDSRWPRPSATNAAGPVAPERRACGAGDGGGDDEKGTFSLTGPTPSLSLLGDDGEYLIRTSVRKRHRPQSAKEGEAASHQAVSATTSFKEKLMMAQQPPLYLTSSRKRPNDYDDDGAGMDEGGKARSFAKPAAKKLRASDKPASCTSPRKGQASSSSGSSAKAVSAAAARAAKRRSVSAEDLLDMCQ